MKFAAVLMGGSDPVYATGGGRHFHEFPDCQALESGRMVHVCRCGDLLCGCATGQPVKPCAMSLSDASMKRLIPCETCYPGFQGIAVQLPADEDFGHRPIDEYANGPEGVSRMACDRCVIWSPVKVEIPKTGTEEIWLIGSRVLWPCMSATILGLVPRTEGSL